MYCGWSFLQVRRKLYSQAICHRHPLITYLSLRIASGLLEVQGETMVLAHRRRHRRDNRSAARMVSGGKFSLKQTCCVSSGPIPFPRSLSNSWPSFGQRHHPKGGKESLGFIHDGRFRNYLHRLFPRRSQSAETLVTFSATRCV